MSRFTQGPKPEFDSRLDLRQGLLNLYEQEPTWPPKEAMMTFARDSLNVQEEDEDEWYQSAWWGYYACRMLGWHRRRQGTDEILDLIEPIDWSPLESSMQSGRGVIMATSHLGPGFVPGMAITASQYPMMAIRGGPGAKMTEGTISAQSDADRRQSLAKALLHLRRGKLILAAPEGGYGSQDDNFLRVRFLNQKVKLRSGVGELARISNAQTCWFSASWTGQARIRLIIQPMPAPTQEDPGQWLREWYLTYLNRMARQISRAPRDIGFQFGVWARARGGVIWYESKEEETHRESVEELELTT